MSQSVLPTRCRQPGSELGYRIRVGLVPDNVLRFFFENTTEVHTTVESWVMLRDTVRVMRLYDVAKPDRLATRGNDKKDNYSTGLTRNTSC